jgi:DNA helicase-2/ATP-dependent DNA helicase PcrA
LHGTETYPLPSRFLREIPPELVREERARPQLSRPVASIEAPEAAGGLRLGQRVLHPKFGEGVVLSTEGQGGSARVHVNFQAVGAKWLMLAYANLEPI